MDPLPRSQATLVDLLDRALTKGIVIHADLVISVAGIPLIGVNLRAALAGMETMIRYGLLKEWDTKIRQQAMAESVQKENQLMQNETFLFKARASWYDHAGLHPAWRYGHLYLTETRLLIYQHPFSRTLMEWPLSHLVHIFPSRSKEQGEWERDILLKNGEVEKIRCHQMEALEEHLRSLNPFTSQRSQEFCEAFATL
ncbi:MAG: gas vesicle protein [Desulfobacterales bacterium]|nr:gas vesicle protein [Desulfobacterales bacterium]